MSSRNVWQQTVYNEYLGRSKVIKAATEYELDVKAQDQLAIWAEQEQRKREQEQRKREQEEAKRRLEEMKAQAEADTAAAQREIDAYRTLLVQALKRDHRVDWEALLDRRAYADFEFSEPGPEWRPPGRLRTLQEVSAAIGVPRSLPLLEAVLPFLRRRREAAKADARDRWVREKEAFERRKRSAWEAHLKAKGDHEARKQAARAEYERGREEFHARQAAHNAGIDKWRADLEAGEFAAIVNCIRALLERSDYPSAIAKDFEVDYEPVSGTVVVAYWLPNPVDLPRAVEYRFVATRKETNTVEMKQKEFDAFYECTVQQVVLRTIHEILSCPDLPHIQCVVFNGWVHGIDPKTGQEFTSCIVSCQAAREEFQGLNLAQVDPRECLRGLRALEAGPLAQLAPVRPILELRRDDPRFVESREVLADLGPQDNLAEMEWEAFEHLVRELFERIFGGEGREVRITRASRDRGVDAVAFDPDPIRGGKFVIQAKRYNDVVPVAAVRDLYGTVINEGAARGILVTTSYYGNDSREFAKDKPLTLIDGPNLVHMFQEHGYDVRIDIKPSRRARSGSR